LGSNLGDRAANLRAALEALTALPGVTGLRASRFYETDPVGPVEQGPFLNAAAVCDTPLSPTALMSRLLEIEHSLGRRPREQRQPWGPREIDLDLLLHGDTVTDTPALTLPHPRMHERAFVLRPLAELAPGMIHPVFNQSVQQLLDALPAEATHA
jgi:2-amino-4-hydroxy-6-hydroxymethyldihydropteridine diphosphokinase